MITGYNTDIEHEGVVYHVQTEDKGLETPLLLSLVYTGGAILASKRTSYADLVESGFDEAVLAEKLSRQHKLICAAINAGRIDDLKRMSAAVRAGRTEAGAPSGTGPLPPLESAAVTENIPDERPVVVANVPAPLGPLPAELETGAGPSARPSVKLPKEAAAYTVYDSRRRGHPADIQRKEEGLHIHVDTEREFRGGGNMEVEVRVSEVSAKGEAPVVAAISVKVLGTAFRPIILSLKTNKQGIAIVSTRIPSFKTGRAAIVIKASAAGQSAETRRVIHPG